MTRIKTILVPLTAHTRLNVAVLQAYIQSASSNPNNARVRFRLARGVGVSASDTSLIPHLRDEFPAFFSEASDFVVDFSKQTDLCKALEGCDGMLLSMGASDPNAIDAELKMVDAATQTGSVTDVWKVSCASGYLGKDSGVMLGAQHWHVQQQVLAAKFTGSIRFVQPNNIMDTLLHGKLFDMICGRSLSVSAKHGRVAFVHPLDVAEVVATLLDPPTMDNNGGVEEVLVTGPEALLFQEVAQQLTLGIGEKVSYNYFPLWAVQPSMWIRGERPEAIANEIQTARALEAGAQETIVPTVEELLGKPPRTFRQFVEEHAKAWPLRAYK